MSAVSLVALIAAFAPIATGAEILSPAPKNTLVQKYCSGCHTDAGNNGGLTLEHFDAAKASPSLIAMLLNKMSDGVAIDAVKQPQPISAPRHY